MTDVRIMMFQLSGSCCKLAFKLAFLAPRARYLLTSDCALYRVSQYGCKSTPEIVPYWVFHHHLRHGSQGYWAL